MEDWRPKSVPDATPVEGGGTGAEAGDEAPWALPQPPQNFAPGAVGAKQPGQGGHGDDPAPSPSSSAAAEAGTDATPPPSIVTPLPRSPSRLASSASRVLSCTCPPPAEFSWLYTALAQDRTTFNSAAPFH